MLSKIIIGISFVLCGSVAEAIDWVNTTNDHNVDQSRTFGNSGADVYMKADQNFFINSISVVDSGSWSNDINTYFIGQHYDYATGNFNDYNLGEEISSGSEWYIGGLFGGMFTMDVANSVSAGDYSAKFQVRGGSTSADNSVLFEFTENLHVFDTFGLKSSSPDLEFNLAPGDTALIRHQLDYSGTRDFLVNTRYVGWSQAGVDQFDINFVGPYPDHLSTGDSIFADHVTMHARLNFATPFTFDTGVVGGYGSDDSNWYKTATHTINPVPEPTALVGIAFGLLCLGRKSLRKK